MCFNPTVCAVTQFSANDIVKYVVAYIPYSSSTDEEFWIPLRLIVPMWLSSDEVDLASITHAANTSHRAHHVSLFSPSHFVTAQGKAALGLLQN